MTIVEPGIASTAPDASDLPPVAEATLAEAAPPAIPEVPPPGEPSITTDTPVATVPAETIPEDPPTQQAEAASSSGDDVVAAEVVTEDVKDEPPGSSDATSVEVSPPPPASPVPVTGLPTSEVLPVPLVSPCLLRRQHHQRMQHLSL